MGTSFMLFSPPPLLKPHQVPLTTPFPLPQTHHTASRNKRVHSTSKFGNFLDFKPENKPESLDFDLPWCHPSDRNRFDVIIIGAGPAGTRLAEQVSLYGVKVCCVDPDPLSVWPNNYGVWRDEFESLGLEDCLDKTWPMAFVYVNDGKSKYLDRCYGRVGRRKLKERLVQGCVSNGVRFHKAKVWQVEHQEFESKVLCDDGWN